MAGDPGARGHRIRPHTADVILEAWAPTPAACIEEAVRCLFDTFAIRRGDGGGRTVDVTVSFEPAPLDEQLALTLEEAIYLVDARDLVTVDASLTLDTDNRLTGVLHTVPVDQVDTIGSCAKGVSYEQLDTARDPHSGTWRCQVIVDV